MLRPNYLWNFPLSSYDSQLDTRQSGVSNMLRDVRIKRDEERSQKKQ
jgi:hypothetical protein